jgi:flagellar protein FliL
MADAPKSAEGVPAEAPAQPKKKTWLWIAIAVFVLAAGGGGAFFMFGSDSEEQETADDADDKKGAKAGKNGKAGKNAKAAKNKHKEPAQYVKLEPPFVVNFEAKGLMRFLQISVEVMTRDSATIELIKKNDPMIRNDLIMLFGSQQYESISTREGKEKLRADALKVVAKVIGDEGGDAERVEQLYFTSFVMQ